MIIFGGLSKWSKIVENGHFLWVIAHAKWSKNVKMIILGGNWSKIVQNGHFAKRKSILGRFE